MDEPARRVIYKGRKIDLALQAVELADGTTAEREVVLHRGAVALLAIVDDERLCLVENHRYAVGKTLLEVPAGTLDPLKARILLRGLLAAGVPRPQLHQAFGVAGGYVDPSQWPWPWTD